MGMSAARRSERVVRATVRMRVGIRSTDGERCDDRHADLPQGDAGLDGKLLIGVFIGKSGVTSVFGAAASLAVVLIWVYYSAQIFLMGAEFTWVYAHTFGSLTEQPMAPAGSVPSRAQTAEGAAGSPPNDRPRPI